MIKHQDYTRTIPENFVSLAEAVDIDGSSFTPSGVPINSVRANYVMCTDVAISGSLTSPNVPLQFQYQPKFDLSTSEPSGGIVLRDEYGDIVDSTQYKIQFGNSILHPDGDPARYAAGITWSDHAQAGVLHRSRILLSADLGNGDRVLKAEYPAYRLNRTVYHSEYVNPTPLYLAQYDYHVTNVGSIQVANDLSGATKLYIQRHPDRNVRVLPARGGETDAWYPKVRIGYFGTGGTEHIQGYRIFQVPNNELGASGALLADVTEYQVPNSMSIVPHATRHSSAIRIDANTLQVPDAPLVIDVSGVNNVDENDGYPWYKPRDIDVTGSGMYTHEGVDGPSGISIFVGGNFVPQTDIEDWHRDSGLIKLRRAIPHNADIKVTHRYYPIDATIKSCDMNPGAGHDIWPSGGIRVALSDQGVLGWHPVVDDPSGLYSSGSTFYTANGFYRSSVDASGAKTLGDYTLVPFTPADLQIHEIRRFGGGLQDKRVIKHKESESFL